MNSFPVFSGDGNFDLGFGGYRCGFGRHIAALYETPEERDHIIFHFFARGLKDKNMLLYCPSERTPEDFYTRFKLFCPDCSSKIHSEEYLKILYPKSLYYPDGYFSPIEMQDRLENLFLQTQINGPRFVRAVGEMSWAVHAISGIEQLMLYESRVNEVLSGKEIICICLYNLKKFSGEIIMNVLKTHRLVINKCVLTENPFYLSPAKWLREYTPEFREKFS